MEYRNIIAALTAFAVALGFSVALTPLVRHVAVRRGLFDHALTARKIHGGPIPRLGGIAIVTAFLAALGAVACWDERVLSLVDLDRQLAVAALGGGLVIAALGVYDDLLGADARLKFSVQFAVAWFAYATGVRIEVVSAPLLGTVDVGALGLPLTLLWIAGVTNAMNLIDGLDGLAGGIAVIASIALFAVSVGHGGFLPMLVTAALGGAVVGFLFFNFNPASIFMGDTGSMFLGYVLAVTSIPTAHERAGAVALLVPILALGLPICDTLLAMARRAMRGAPLFAADRGHIHHRLLECGFSQRQATLLLYASSALLAGTALVLARRNELEALLALGVVGMAAFVALRSLGFFQWAQLPTILAERRSRLRAASNDDVTLAAAATGEPGADGATETRMVG